VQHRRGRQALGVSLALRVFVSVLWVCSGPQYHPFAKEHGARVHVYVPFILLATLPEPFTQSSVPSEQRSSPPVCGPVVHQNSPALWDSFGLFRFAQVQSVCA